MSLITCPKCGRDRISTKALFCVGCHCPMSTIMQLLQNTEKKSAKTEQATGLDLKSEEKESEQVKVENFEKSVFPLIGWEEWDFDEDEEYAENSELDYYYEDLAREATIEQEMEEAIAEEIEAHRLEDEILYEYYQNGLNEEEDYLSEYRECLDSLIEDGWFYPDKDKSETIYDGYDIIDKNEF